MSLYNDIADNLSKSGITPNVTTQGGSITQGVADKVSDMMGGGKLAKAVTTIGGAMARNVAINQVNKHIPIKRLGLHHLIEDALAIADRINVKD